MTRYNNWPWPWHWPWAYKSSRHTGPTPSFWPEHLHSRYIGTPLSSFPPQVLPNWGSSKRQKSDLQPEVVHMNNLYGCTYNNMNLWVSWLNTDYAPWEGVQTRKREGVLQSPDSQQGLRTWEGNRQEGQGSPNGGNSLQVSDIFISLKRQEETN